MATNTEPDPEEPFESYELRNDLAEVLVIFTSSERPTPAVSIESLMHWTEGFKEETICYHLEMLADESPQRAQRIKAGPDTEVVWAATEFSEDLYRIPFLTMASWDRFHGNGAYYAWGGRRGRDLDIQALHDELEPQIHEEEWRHSTVDKLTMQSLNEALMDGIEYEDVPTYPEFPIRKEDYRDDRNRA